MSERDREGWREGYGILTERVARLPDAIREASRPAPPLDLGDAPVRSFATSGVGSSAAHARLLENLLEEAGLPARFLPLSSFATAPGPGTDVLVVFSQGISPNARLALSHPERWRAVVLVTAADPGSLPPEIRVRRIPGENELGTLLRVVGPACGIVATIALARELASRAGAVLRVPEVDAGEICRAMETAAARAVAAAAPAGLDGEVAFLTSGAYGGLVGNLQYKLLEGTFRPLPPVFDLLETAHGPFQQAAGRPVSWLALARSDAPAEPELLERLRAMLDPGRHRFVVLEARLPGPWALLEHEAALNALVLRDIAARGIDQVRWPGRGDDQPLYSIGADEPRTRHLERLAWPEVERLVAGGCRTVLVPLGATEQHGPHLPLSTDSTIATALAERFCRRVPEAIAAPVLTLGCSSEHIDFAGTLSLRASTLAAALEDVLRSLRRHGFERVFIFSAHGGNFGALREALSTLRPALAPFEVLAFTDLTLLSSTLKETARALGVPPAESGEHAGELETSILYALDPIAVRRHAVAAGRLEPPANGRSLFYPRLRPNAPDGTVGDPRPADPARAEAYLSRWVDLLVECYRGG